MYTEGYVKLSKQLAKLEKSLGGKALRSAAMSAMLPAQKAAKAAAPVGSPPYGSYGAKGGSFDPYPKKTYKGRPVIPGFTSRSIMRRSKLSRDRRFVSVRLGVKSEAFYAIQFLELGTLRIPKRPWLEPSFHRSIPLVDRIFRQKLRKLLDKAAR